ncbi:NAD(P)(+) transhydrogenase (Re/Si-specific) subunit beta [Wenzhouxiangella sp. XN24]|uniref:NAD(P)(+) transhydrogenase (Re/Si-specific) subunit beta n=1 Tax=Wenzhouxiangella sp. XN24 TaxID=2713569 RepID=UPI0013ED5FF5|nr:NAD(P)(+) transhydrogenase (Re/Si-specific) subunit beta [Wenzhouxiangella sp. XN24]NGX17644.1 NAD(P)(+) transhydrogenase (Re/Si-specific) subunit beta [Wenzhouxiangella sp. XN24]
MGFATFMIKASYFVAALLFIIGLKRMSSPRTARGGVVWAGWGMVLATVVTFFWPGMSAFNIGLILVAILLGGGLAWWTGKKVAMTDMPQMIALYNGMGGGAAGAIAAVTLYKGAPDSLTVGLLAVLGGLIGSVSFSGSLIAFAKLQGWMKKPIRFRTVNQVNAVLLLGSLIIGLFLLGNYPAHTTLVTLFFVLALVAGIMLTSPIGGADMPVVISLYNALTGLAVAFKGFVLDNEAMIIAGTVVGAAGTLLTQLMAKAMNRSLASVLFSAFGDESVDSGEVEGSLKPIESSDAGIMMAFSDRVIIIPGYGLAVAQAQHKVWELAQLLQSKGVKVRFAIHPVAGRMPGHMNVLLAEAGVPYDLIADLDEINPDFDTTDVALVIGANDVVNPVARTDPSSPIYGMPILNADKAKNVIVIKRGKGKGFSGIENRLFYLDNTRMLYGDGQAAVSELIHAIKAS